MPVDRAVAGDVVAVAKLNDVQVGDVLGEARAQPRPGAEGAPDAGDVGRGHRHSRKDDEKVSTALHRLAEEDPSLRVRHDADRRATS